MTIPPMNESDRDRDPLEDYEYGLKLMRVPSSALHAWIRRAVHAEAELARAKGSNHPHGSCSGCGYPNRPDGCCSRPGCYNSD